MNPARLVTVIAAASRKQQEEEEEAKKERRRGEIVCYTDIACVNCVMQVYLPLAGCESMLSTRVRGKKQLQEQTAVREETRIKETRAMYTADLQIVHMHVMN